MQHAPTPTGDLLFTDAGEAIAFAAGVVLSEFNRSPDLGKYKGVEVVHSETFTTICTDYGTDEQIDWAVYEVRGAAILLSFAP